MASILFNNLSDQSNKPHSVNSSKDSFLASLKKFFINPIIDFKNILVYTGILLFCTIPYFAIYPEKIMVALNIPFITWAVILLPIFTLSVWLFLSFRNFPLRDSLNEIQALIDRMSYEVSESHHTGLKDKIINFGFSRHKKTLPISSREAEELLINILRNLQPRYRIAFVLDEIDKLSDDEELLEINHHDKPYTQEASKSEKINTLLGSLKNFISIAPAIFFFISGRETLDRYYSEKGSPNSLYGSLFDQVFEVPSFLTDKGNRPARNTQLYASIEEYVCRCIRTPMSIVKDNKSGNDNNASNNKNDKYYTLQSFGDSFVVSKDGGEEENREFRYGISILMNFILYLTFHSWGNPKKLYSIFESFVYPHETIEKGEARKSLSIILGNNSKEPEKPKYYLVFSANHLRSFSLASEITTLFQHQLSREVSQISDKLAVSSFSSLHFILKLHSYGFKRETLYLMSEAINIYRSPELNTIVDDLLTNIFKSYIRRVRNGLYRYRFHSGFEQELRYVSHVSGLESASFNFSLDSMRYVKRFFEIILANSNSLESDVISRAHISLGDMCTIEQSYNAASLHYHTASRLLANILKNEGATTNQETLMQYIEVLLKHGDLEERRQNYNHAAAIYSEADHIVQNLSGDKELSLHLQSGDSKWDLLKLPFWAGRYLDLKRSPRPYKKFTPHLSKMTQPPEYLYRSSDPRFHYRAASYYFFLGEAEQAIESYKATLGYAGYEANSTIDERNAYMIGNSIVGIVESTLLYKSRELFHLIKEGNKEDKTANNKITGEFLGKLLTFILSPDEFVISSLDSPKPIESLLDEAVDIFERNRLYISAAIVHIKAIHYQTSLWDLFDKGMILSNPQNTFNLYLPGSHPVSQKIYTDHKLKYIREQRYNKIINRVNNAISCINKARQLESNQSNKTLLAYNILGKSNDKTSLKITSLFDILLSSDKSNSLDLSEGIFWQQSLWSHKLASSLFWTDYVFNKICEDDYHSFEEAIPLPKELNMLSVRASIVMRWTYARHLCRKYVDKRLLVSQGLSSDGEFIINYIFCLNDGLGKIFNQIPEVLIKVCEVSRHLYLAQESSRIISRKNLDLIFPRTPQLYLAQWKLLSNLVSAIVAAKKQRIINGNSSDLTSVPLNSIRDVSFLIQKALLYIDKEQAAFEKIPPSHFDYEHVYTRLIESLESSISLIDRNSRTHMGIFEYKYFCHDDHNDPEFRMDYTLAYMYSPIAIYWRNEAERMHGAFISELSKV